MISLEQVHQHVYNLQERSSKANIAYCFFLLFFPGRSQSVNRRWEIFLYVKIHIYTNAGLHFLFVCQPALLFFFFFFLPERFVPSELPVRELWICPMWFMTSLLAASLNFIYWMTRCVWGYPETEGGVCIYWRHTTVVCNAPPFTLPAVVIWEWKM
jgi:hypothetical protein